MIDNLQELVPFLQKHRNLQKAKLVEEAEAEDGYFDADSYSGGNITDAFDLGQETGKAELIEDLIDLLGGAEELGI